VFYRPESGTYVFRWVVPGKLREVFGRTELRRSLRTSNPKLAERLGRRLSAMLERAKLEAMARNLKDTPTFALIIKVFEQAMNGAIRIEGLEMDPANAEKERELLDAFVSKVKEARLSSTSATTTDSGHKPSDLINAYLAEKVLQGLSPQPGGGFQEPSCCTAKHAQRREAEQGHLERHAGGIEAAFSVARRISGVSLEIQLCGCGILQPFREGSAHRYSKARPDCFDTGANPPCHRTYACGH
jgi:hypothetical protein